METEKGLALALHREDDVHVGDGLSARVLSGGEGISEELLHEGHEDLTRILVDLEGDSLDTSSAGQSSDGSLGDALNDGLGGSAGGFPLGSKLS